MGRFIFLTKKGNDISTCQYFVPSLVPLQFLILIHINIYSLPKHIASCVWVLSVWFHAHSKRFKGSVVPCQAKSTSTASRRCISPWGAPTRTPLSTGWPVCWKEGRTPCMWPGGWSASPARTWVRNTLISTLLRFRGFSRRFHPKQLTVVHIYNHTPIVG